jgi:hypothetical protein
VGASYNALDTQAQLVSIFTGGGSAFTTQGLAISPWLFNAGVGLNGFAYKNVRVGVSYKLNLSNSQYINQMLNAELQVIF